MGTDGELPSPISAGWLEALAVSEADLAAGRVVSGEVVTSQLRRTIAEMEAEASIAATTADAVRHR